MGEKEQIDQKLKEKYDGLSSEAKRLIGKVLNIEKEKLHLGKPHGVNDEILKAIDEVIE